MNITMVDLVFIPEAPIIVVVFEYVWIDRTI